MGNSDEKSARNFFRGFCNFVKQAKVFAPGPPISIILIKKLLLSHLSKTFLIRIILISDPGSKKHSPQ